MKTYRHLYEQLRREVQNNQKYEVLYLNTLSEVFKLRQIVDAIYEENPEKLKYLLIDYQQLYRRYK